MPTRARCPQCNASLPHGALWCSLCHADLRPAPETARRVLTPAGPAPALQEHDHPPVDQSDELPGSAAADAWPGQPPEVIATGRHRRVEQPAPGSRTAPSRAARSRAAGSRSAGSGSDAPGAAQLREEVDALVADAPVGADGKPDLEVLTSQLMARLASAEVSNAAVPDLDAVPGGKWGVLVGGMLALTLVLVLLAFVVGAVFLR